MSESPRPKLSDTPAERWSLPQIEGRIMDVRRRDFDNDPQARARTAAAELALARAATNLAAEAAANEARERGYQEGMKAAQAEMKSRLDELTGQVGQLEQILGLLARPLSDLDEQVQQQLVRLATAVGRQLARRELTLDPGQVIAIIREAVGRLPAAARDVRVHLNPRDATAVRERLASPSQDRAWTLVEDPTLTAGGCLVRSDTSQIDARVESRVNAIVAELFGELRARDRGAEAADPAPDAQVLP